MHRISIKAFIAALVVIVLGIVILFVVRYLTQNDQKPADTAAIPAAAPLIVAPVDGTPFVESELVLQWDWPRQLPANQTFAVHVWFGDESPREVWTSETTLNAQDLIDSYIQAVGDYHWQVAVIQVAEGGGFERMVSAWSPVQTLHRVRHISPPPFAQADQSPLTQYILAQNLPTTSAIIDYTRQFIYDHALNGLNDTNVPTDQAIQMMYGSLKGQSDKPHLYCDGRATVELVLLREMGIDSRLIFLYGDNTTQVQQHTFLEVFNPDTQQWEVSDPFYNLYYIDTDSQARASIERIVFGSLDTIAACDGATGACSPRNARPYRKYFEAFRYGHTDTFYVNPDRFDLSKRFPNDGNANLAELLTGHPRDFKFIFDNWTTEHASS